MLPRNELLARINSFNYWHYPFDLGNGVVISPTKEKYLTKKPQLRDFIWQAVLELCDGSVKGLRVLDVACNAGFWSLEAHRLGAAYVLGIDGRPQHIEQAQLVRDALGIDRSQLEYREMNIYDLSPERVGEYDLVLLLRILNHLCHPFLALEKVRSVCRRCLVVDVKLAVDDRPTLHFRSESNKPLQGLGSNLALWPSPSGVELMLTHVGFAGIRQVPPKRPLASAYFEMRRGLYTALVP